MDIEADRLVFWTRSDFQQAINGLRTTAADGATEDESNKTPEEFYLSGNVELRNQTPKESRLIRADEVYYHTGKNLALALNAVIELKQPTLPEPVITKTKMLIQQNIHVTKVEGPQTNASKLPYDPGLEVSFTTSTITERTVPKTTLFGYPVNDPKTGLPEQDVQRIFEGRNPCCAGVGCRSFTCPTWPATSTIRSGRSIISRSITIRFSAISSSPIWNVTSLFGLHRLPGTRGSLIWIT